MNSLKPSPVCFDLSQYPWPCYSEAEIEAVTAVLRSGKVNYWTGNLVREFEDAFAKAFGLKHAIAMANGTVTLQASLRALGIGPGDEVITSPRTYIGTSSAVVMEGVRPIMVDVDSDSGNITIDNIERALTKGTRAIIPVHLAGWPCEMDPIVEFAHANNLAIIEDCAQAHGAKYKDQSVGTFGSVGSWSYCQDKIMTTGGEGGMAGTNDEGLWSRLWSLKDHGKAYGAVHSTEHGAGFRWVHETWGTNWRLTEMQAAIGLCQLRKLDEWKAMRRRNARILEQRLEACSALRVPKVPTHMEHAYYKLYAYIRPEALKADWSRDRVLAALEERGVPGLSGSCPEIYLEKAFTSEGYGLAQRLPVARQLGETSVMFLVHPTLTEEAMNKMADVVLDTLRQASL